MATRVERYIYDLLFGTIPLSAITFSHDEPIIPVQETRATCISASLPPLLALHMSLLNEAISSNSCLESSY